MITIWKYPFAVQDQVKISMPKGAKIVHIESFRGPCLWALVDTERPIEQRTFYVFGTGHEIVDYQYKSYVGTLIQPPFVWHFFEIDLARTIGGLL